MGQIEETASAVIGRKRLGGRGVPSRQEQVLLARHIGERLREAREMQGYSQIKAAKLLGYANSTKLAKIEGGRDSSQVPAWVLKNAALVYDVSIDFLLGNTESMEVDEQRNHAARDTIILMRAQWEKQHWRDMTVIRSAQERVDSVETTVALMADQLDEAVKALSRLEELNPRRWSEMKGGSRLQCAVERASATARTASDKLKRMRREAQSASGGVQPELDLVY